MNTTKPQPADHVRLGSISAAIWANETEKGVRYGVSFERLYKDPQSGKWKSSATFNRDDLLVLAKVSDLAHSRIHELQAQSRSQDRDEAGDADPVETQPVPPAPRAGGASASPPSDAIASQRTARAKARSGVTR